MSKNSTSSMKLSNEVIAQIAKLLQLAILTGTDIVDNLRMVTLTQNESTGNLVLTDEYREISEGQIEKLMEEAQAFQSEVE